MGALIDLTGQTFGGLTVIGRAPSRETPNGTVVSWWRTVCRCGAQGETSSQNLRRGFTRSCGSAGCRGRYNDPHSPASGSWDDLAARHRAGDVGTVAALYRAAIEVDHAAVRDLILGLEPEEYVGVLANVLTIGATGLVRAEGRVGAHRVVNGLAAIDRGDA